MPKCPECNKEIEYLNSYQSGESHYRLWNDGGYELREFQPDGKVNDYECPECQDILFRNEEDAMTFIGAVEDKDDIQNPISTK